MLAQRRRQRNGEEAFSVLATYELALKCSNLFNMLDARGAISVTERVGVIGRIRNSGRGCGEGVRVAASACLARVSGVGGVSPRLILTTDH